MPNLTEPGLQEEVPIRGFFSRIIKMFLFSQTYLKHDKLAYFSYLKEAKN
jgi:hypothetical protein